MNTTRKKPLPPDPPEADASRQAADLAAFRRMMQVSNGTFSLSFAVCHDPALRASIIREFRTEFFSLLVVTLPDNVTDVLTYVRTQLPAATPEAIFILGLESSIPYEAEVQPAIRVLNSSREAWESLHCPVVFWLAEYALARLARLAPDFWRYRSHQFEFIPDEISLEKAKLDPFPGHNMIDALPYEEKRFRLSELETRLREVGSPPSPEMLPHVVDWGYELAKLYQHSNRSREAETLLRHILTWEISTHGEYSLETSTALNNLALVLQPQNRLSEAEVLFEKALENTEAQLGKDHPDVAVPLNNLAQVFKATGRLDEAEPLMRRALALDESGFGQNHPNVSRHLNNLALLLNTTNRKAEAEPLYRRALAVDQAAYGKSHPTVAIDLNNLAHLLKDTGRLAEAEQMMQDALRIMETCYGIEHSDSITVRKNLRLLQKKMGSS